MTRDYIDILDYLGMHDLSLKTFKSDLIPPFPQHSSIKIKSQYSKSQDSIITKHKSPIIHHLHLYNPPDSPLKLSRFTKIVNAMKTLNQFFSRKKEAERDRVNAR